MNLVTSSASWVAWEARSSEEVAICWAAAHLKHCHDGIGLDPEYARGSHVEVARLWGKPCTAWTAVVVSHGGDRNQRDHDRNERDNVQTPEAKSPLGGRLRR